MWFQCIYHYYRNGGMIVDDIWGLSESALLLIEDKLDELLKEEEDEES